MGLLASCAKVTEEVIPAEIDPEISNVKTVLTVGIGTDTKTYLGDDGSATHKVYWSNGDVIAVNGVDSDPLAGLVGDNNSAEFTLNGLLSTPYKAIYPASIYTDATHITLPDSQTWVDDNIADDMFPMAAYSEDGSGLAMKHLCSIIKVSIMQATSGDADDIVQVRFKGRNNEQVKGLFSIDYENHTITGASSALSDKEVKVNHTQETSTSDAVIYYLVVPAGTYSSGFDVIVKDENNHVMTKSKTTSTTLVAGKLYNLTEFDFVPTTTEIGVDISNASELIAFAQAFDNGSYDSPMIPVVKLTANISGFTDEQITNFNATGGIGSSSKKFHGIFDGEGYTIADLAVTAPLFSHIGPTGVVKNVKLTSTCSVTYSSGISADTDLGAIAGYSEGFISDCVNMAPVSCNSSEYTDGMLNIGGIVGRQNATGTISDCTNYGAVTSTAPVSDDAAKSISKSIFMGGIVGTVARPASGNTALIENCANHGDVKNGLDTGEPVQTCLLHLGGVVGWIYSTSSSADITIAGLVNTGNVTKTNNSARDYDGHCVLVGGLIGGIHGEGVSDYSGQVAIKNSHVKNCRVQTGNFNNSNGYGEASQAGGFVALARGNQSTKNISFSDNCYVEDVYVICRRGFAGGFVSWARGVVFNGCQVLNSSVRGNLANCYFGGGIAGCAYDCTLTNCIAQLTKEDTLGDSYDTYTLYTKGNSNMTGGIVGQARGTTSFDGCKAFVKKMYQGDSGKEAYRGWIAGYIDDNSGKETPSITIKDCAIGGACTSATAVTLDSDNYNLEYNGHTFGYFYGSKGEKASVNFTGTQSYWDANGAPSGRKTVDITIADYASDNSWVNGGTNFYSEVSQGGVTLTASANQGYTNGNYNTQWRFYQARGGGLTVSVPIGYSLVSATFTYTSTNTGVLLAPDKAAQISSGTKYNALFGRSAFFALGNTTDNVSNGQVRFTNIVIEYE